MTKPIAESCVVSDSTCLIGLERIERLDILPQLYSHFYIPLAVKAEIGFSEPWMTVCEVKNAAHIVITGTAGMLLKAKRQGVISRIAPILSDLEAAEFRLSPALRRRTLELADEL